MYVRVQLIRQLPDAQISMQALAQIVRHEQQHAWQAYKHENVYYSNMNTILQNMNRCHEG